MLMASHRQLGFPLEAANSHWGNWPASHCKVLGMKLYSMVVEEGKGVRWGVCEGGLEKVRKGWERKGERGSRERERDTERERGRERKR